MKFNDFLINSFSKFNKSYIKFNINLNPNEIKRTEKLFKTISNESNDRPIPKSKEKKQNKCKTVLIHNFVNKTKKYHLI